jgi:hypothetical protein
MDVNSGSVSCIEIIDSVVFIKVAVVAGFYIFRQQQT